MMTTATLRSAARDAADLCSWQEAADLMTTAIARHPGNRNSPMVRHDIERMEQLATSWRLMTSAGE